MTATVGIDPRIRARRIAVRRDAGRQRLRRVQALTAVAVGLVIAFGLTRSPVLDVDRLEVQAGGGDVAAIREAAGVVPGEPMTGVDPRQVAEAVAALPSVASAEVHRSWPGTVAVSVTPRELALAVPAVGGGWLAVGPDGVVVEQRDEVPPGLAGLGGFEVRGAPGDELPGELRPAAAVAGALGPGLVDRLVHLELGDATTVLALLGDGGTVVFDGGATPAELSAAAAAALAVLETVPSGCTDRLDVTSSQTPVLRRSAAC